MALSREEVAERVKSVLSEQLGVDEGELLEEASFQEDLDADSLDLVELIMELEDQFGIRLGLWLVKERGKGRNWPTRENWKTAVKPDVCVYFDH